MSVVHRPLRLPDGTTAPEPTIVSIDLSEIAFR